MGRKQIKFKCPECDLNDVRKRGYEANRDKPLKAKTLRYEGDSSPESYYCKKCNHLFVRCNQCGDFLPIDGPGCFECSHLAGYGLV